MPRSKTAEKFRTKLHVAFGQNSTNAVRYMLKPRKLRQGSEETIRQYAVVLPTRYVNQTDLCNRLAAENRKYSAGEYNMIIDQIIEAITYDLRCGNCVTLPQLGFFAPSIAGAFDPNVFTGEARHPLRMTLRVSSAFNDNLNRGAALKYVDALPPSLKIKEVAYSMASEVRAAYFGGESVCVGAIRSAARQIVFRGAMRNLPQTFFAELQELKSPGIPDGEVYRLPAVPLTPPTRQSQRVTLLSVDACAVSDSLLPGTSWRFRFSVGTGDPQLYDFTVEG